MFKLEDFKIEEAIVYEGTDSDGNHISFSQTQSDLPKIYKSNYVDNSKEE